jgi:thiosulfate/3-mercaptopyruvate sulfurtransferase
MAGFAHPELLVETDWLEQHLGDPKVVVLDCTTHLIPNPKITYDVVPGSEDFEKGHIKGAQFCDVSRDVSDTSHKFRFMRQTPDDFAAAMRRFGVSDDTKVVLYSTTSPQWASRVWWLLREFGHDNAAVLNGGWQKWSRENRPSETGAGQRRPAGTFTAKPPRNLMADKNQVKAAIGDGAICTLNALSADQHKATGGNTYGRPGRIAGSANLPAAQLLDPATNTFLPADELRRKFDQVGAIDREVIVYCGGGIAATADALVLTMLGHTKVKVYDASMSEWAKDESLPMETG